MSISSHQFIQNCILLYLHLQLDGTLIFVPNQVLTSKDKDVSSKNQTTPVLNKYDEVSETTDEDDLVMM